MEGREGGLPDGVNNQLQTFLNALLQQQGIPEGSSVPSHLNALLQQQGIPEGSSVPSHLNALLHQQGIPEGSTVASQLNALLQQQGIPEGSSVASQLNALLQQQGILGGASVPSQSLAAFGNVTSNNAQGRGDSAALSLVQQQASAPTNALNHQGSYNPMMRPLALTPFTLSQLLSNQNALQLQTGGVAPFAQQNQSFFNFSQPQSFSQAALPGPNASLSSQPTTASSIPSTGRTLSLFLSVDEDNLSTYQCLVRKQIELFEATQDELEANAQGRNKPILQGQVGIRCRHCGVLPLEERKKGAVYFPSQLVGLYQTAQNMANSHLLKNCSNIPRDIREDLIRLREVRKAHKSGAGGGREYWANGLRVQGVVEFDRRLRFSMIQNAGEGGVSVHVKA